jgi:hypothetical protein
MAQQDDPPLDVIDPVKESTACLVAIAFQKVNSPAFASAVLHARGADVYRLGLIDGKPFHFTIFRPNATSAAKACALLNLVSGWKGVIVSANGQLVPAWYKMLAVLDCYVTSTRCADYRAHCFTMIDDPSLVQPARVGGIVISMMAGTVKEEAAEIDRYSFPCSLIVDETKLHADHPASFRDQIQAAAVKRCADHCPNFNADSFAATSKRTVRRTVFKPT